jgi:protein-S-isoprenylcysteine O-methyltransferase Ste14
MMRPTWAGLREAGVNILLALYWGVFAVVHLQGFAIHPRPSLLLIVAMETLAAVLFLLRAPATRTNTSPFAWLTTVGGTLTPLLLRPTGAVDSVAGQVLQVAGALLAVAALASLNRSFGLLPAVRGVRQGGVYRYVRHPLYAAYTLQGVGYLLSNRSAVNLAVVVAGLGFQVLRMGTEERILSTEPAYRDYMARTRWRLLPFVY